MTLDDKLVEARVRTWDAVERIAQQITPGMLESQAIQIAQKTLAQMGVRKFWHKCHVRFGASSVLSYADPYVDSVLRDDDIFVIDIGPIWNGIEGDAGATFVVGENVEMKRCQTDVKLVFDAVKDHWKKTKASGEALYQYAEKEAASRGWILAPSYVRGHRISEFPHSVHSELHVNELEVSPAPLQWVLEIHISDPQLRFGAFYEDILL